MADGIAIIGAGYAGLAAAAELASRGVACDIFEASRTLGGRARGVAIDGMTLDNGAHILVGAYGETLRLMRLVAAPAAALKRQPLHLEFPGQFRLHAPRLPAPLHLAWALASAQGLSWREKFAALRFMRGLKARHFRLPVDVTVAELLAKQPDRLRRFLWQPLCLAALNTPPAEASAQVFVNVLRDSLAAGRAASDLLLPATDFASLFPEPAARWLAARGTAIHRGTRIGTVTMEMADGSERYFLDGRGPYRQVIIAVAPRHVAALLGVLPRLTLLHEQLAALRWQPIVTCYLRYPAPVRLPVAMAGVDGGYAQWLFDRGALRGQTGVIGAVISGPGRHDGLDADALAMRIDAEVRRIVPDLPEPTWHRVIAEKRATFACTPGLKRPWVETPLPGLLLAGDYIDGDYPATLEGAVRSGVAAALSAYCRIGQPAGRQP
ncbi:MAG: FAD-dependent oxidoreductase [Rhodocyclaceae bacterium]|nr:FAD-dependent oxidoreductase [Rhodocyclaceae bacterium]